MCPGAWSQLSMDSSSFTLDRVCGPLTLPCAAGDGKRGSHAVVRVGARGGNPGRDPSSSRVGEDSTKTT